MRHPSAPVAQLPLNELKELQQLLVRAGFNVGKVDGVMGQLSRTAVKAMQVKYGLPAEFLADGGIAGADARTRRTGDAGRHGAGGAVGSLSFSAQAGNPVRRGLSAQSQRLWNTGSPAPVRKCAQGGR